MKQTKDIIADVERVQRELAPYLTAKRGSFSWWPKHENTRYTDMLPRHLTAYDKRLISENKAADWKRRHL